MGEKANPILKFVVIALFLLSSAFVIFGMNTVSAAPPLPDAPTGLTAVVGYEQVSLSWTAPVSNGDNPIDYYVIHREIGYTDTFGGEFTPNSPSSLNETRWNVGVELPDNTAVFTAIITGLPHQYRTIDFFWTYSFTVAAAYDDAFGTGPQCDPVTANPNTAPSSVGPIDVNEGNRQVSMVWEHDPAHWDDGGYVLLDYVIYQDGANPIYTLDRSVTITGLKNGQSYVFSIAKHTNWGNGPLAYATVIPMAIPDEPSGLAATPGNGQVLLNWTAPANSAESFITGYIVYQGGDFNAYSLATSITVTGLKNNHTYTFFVLAYNNLNERTNGPESSVSVTPRPETSSEPAGLVATPGDGQIILSWLPPGNDGGAQIVNYTVYQNNIEVEQVIGTSVVINGLINGQSYYFTVAARNYLGLGPNSTAVQVIPYTIPDAPTGYVATPGNGQVTLTWAAPTFNGGRTIDYYIAYQDGSALSYHLTGPSTIIPGLDNGHEYSFTISAHNLAGIGPQSTAMTATPSLAPTIPGAPTGLIANPGNAQASLSWIAPSNNGNASIDYYIVYQGGKDVGHPTINSTKITGLNNGQSYTFTVAAHNSVGIGLQCNPVPFIPLTVPGTPNGLSATPRNGQVSLSWSTPSTNGATIDYYVVYQNGIDIAHTTSASKIVTELTNGVSYTFNVAAHNAAGTGSQSSSVSATPNALTTALTVPGAPTGFGVAPGISQVTLSWSAPASDGGATIDYYLVYVDGVARSDHYTTVPITVNGLTNGQQYTFTVAAHNSVGVGPNSTEATAIPSPAPTIPGAPTGFGVAPGIAQVTLSWSAPASDGGGTIDYYLVYVNGVVRPDHYTTVSMTVTNLTNGQQYTFAVAAHNSVGVGSQSSAMTASPSPAPTVPAAPIGLVATPGNAQVNLTWTAPSNNGGAPIDYYLVYVDGVARPDHYTTASMSVTGLTNGHQYTFAVAAHNSIGIGPQSTAVTASPSPAPTVPAVPLGLIATPANAQVFLSWTSPNNNGGAVIDYYLVYVDGVIQPNHYSTKTTTITGLTNGQEYSFTIAAHNSVGASVQSSAVNATPTTMTTVPDLPTGLMAAPGNAHITLSWTAPSNDGGAAIDYYIVYQDGIDISHPNATTKHVTGLTNGQPYSYTVAAHNSVGNGVQTSTIMATPISGAAVPGIPTGLIATAGIGKVMLSWTAPSGSSNIDYFIVYQNGIDVVHTFATSATINGLTNGENYSYAVAAHNSGGVGNLSAAQTVSPGAASSNNGATNYLVVFIGVLVLLSAAAIVMVLVVRGRQKKK